MHLEQLGPRELSAVTEISVPPIPTHVWLPSTINGASATEKLNFYLYLILITYKQPLVWLVATVQDRVGEENSSRAGRQEACAALTPARQHKGHHLSGSTLRKTSVSPSLPEDDLFPQIYPPFPGLCPLASANLPSHTRKKRRYFNGCMFLGCKQPCKTPFSLHPKGPQTTLWEEEYIKV